MPKIIASILTNISSQLKKLEFYKISIAFSDLRPAKNSNMDLFIDNPMLKQNDKNHKISIVLDKIRAKYHDNKIIALATNHQQDNLANKIAFARIPKLEEYY